MKKIIYILTTIISLTSCVDVEEYDNNPSGNLEALWKIMDERYCFFQEKQQQLGVDWNAIHSEFSAQVSSNMSDYQLFELMGNMLSRLKDGHVNLYSTFDTSRSWQWKENYPTNFSDSLSRVYLGKSSEYKLTNGIAYKKLNDNVGYVYISSFEYSFSNSSLDEILSYLSDCKGLILDIRNNGGGQLTSAESLAARFANAPTLVGYMRHKTGAGHNDFSDYESQNIEPSSGIRWQKPVCLLTNRSVFSAANEFTKYLKAIGQSAGSPMIKVIGDNTGGGAGMPYSSELPNGWTIRFSACPTYDINKVCVEDGIAPDVKVDISSEDYQRDVDTIIETARNSF